MPHPYVTFLLISPTDYFFTLLRNARNSQSKWRKGVGIAHRTGPHFLAPGTAPKNKGFWSFFSKENFCPPAPRLPSLRLPDREFRLHRTVW
jgi:hypothetical protein